MTAAAPGPTPATGPLAAPLLRWFDRHRRDLPWRRQPSPYRTLVSELMLQQTVVATVVPYFERFVRRFPDFASLAAAREEEVTALWSGLGYYARARHLRRAALAVVAEHGGALPSEEESLRALPGVGPYTAAAVAAIAFDRRAFALDGNGIRVLARLHAVRAPANRPATRAHLHRLGLALVPATRAGDFNQAVMELGALVCSPRAPSCGACPVRAHCAGLARGLALDALPVKQPRPARKQIRIACAVVARRGRVLLVRRQPGELLAGTWALPSAVVGQGTPAVEAARRAALASGVAVGPGLTAASALGRVRHVFTHRDLTAEIFALTEERAGAGRAADAASDQQCRWVDPGQLGDLGISSFTRKTLTTAGIGARKRDRRGKSA
jgi:A/G-specific adenine glycosylase